MKPGLLFLLFSLLPLTVKPNCEIRAVWLTTNYALDWPATRVSSQADIEKQKAELDHILDELKAANFNVVFFQTRLRGDVIYPSRIEPWYNYLNGRDGKDPGYDPLEYAVEACHLRGLECHAWFVTYPVGRISKSGISNHPTVKKNSRLVIRHDGEYYLDPGNPETNTYLLSLVEEIVTNYDIDGIHFDYIRYPDKAHLFQDNASFRKYGKGKDKRDWRRENINRFVYESYDMIKAVKPWVQVSSSVVGMYETVSGSSATRTAYQSVFQDPADWLEKEKHDFIVPMMYYTDDLFFPFVPNWVEKKSGGWIVPGIGVYRLDREDQDWEKDVIVGQVEYSRTHQAHGNAYYRAQQLLENRKGILAELKENLYAYPAKLPPMVRDGEEIPASPGNIRASMNGSFLSLSWENNPHPYPETSLYYNVYCSHTDSIDIMQPENLLAVRLPANEISFRILEGEEGGFFYAVTSTDRYHNESELSSSVYFCFGDFEK